MKMIKQSWIFLIIAALLLGLSLTGCGLLGGDEDSSSSSQSDDDDEEKQEEEEEEEEEEPTPDPTAEFVGFINETLGLSMSYPEEWAIEVDEAASELTLGSSQATLDNRRESIEGALFTVVTFDLSLMEVLAEEGADTSDPIAMLNAFQGNFTEDAGDSEFEFNAREEASGTTVNGQDAAVMAVEITDSAGGEAVANFVFIVSGERGAFIVSGVEASVEDDFESTLEAILNTVTLSPDAMAEPVVIEDIPEVPEEPVVEVPTSEGLVLYGDTVSASVTEAGPSIWGFVALEGEVVDIIVEPGEDFDVVVDVLDETGASILESGEIDDSFDTEEILGLTIPATGTYNISVRGFAGATGDYQMSIAEAGTTVGGGATGPTEATGGEIQYGEFATGSIDTEESVAAWDFAAQGSKGAQIIVTPFDELDVVVDVVDSAGNSVLGGPHDLAFGTEYVHALLPADGTYTILLSGYQGTTGTFDLELGQPIDNIVYATPDTLEEADLNEGHAFPFRALSAGDMVGIMVQPEGELDVAVQVRQGGEVLTDAGFDPERGYDQSFGIEEFVFVAPEGDSYSFAVLNSIDEGSVTVGDYEVTLYGTSNVIFELAFGDFVDARTGGEGFVDYFLRGIAGDVVTISVTSDDDSIDAMIQILDLNENILTEVDDNFSGEDETLTYTFDVDDLVLIRVRDFFDGVGGFTMTVDSGG